MFKSVKRHMVIFICCTNLTRLMTASVQGATTNAANPQEAHTRPDSVKSELIALLGVQITSVDPNQPVKFLEIPGIPLWYRLIDIHGRTLQETDTLAQYLLQDTNEIILVVTEQDAGEYFINRSDIKLLLDRIKDQKNTLEFQEQVFNMQHTKHYASNSATAVLDRFKEIFMEISDQIKLQPDSDRNELYNKLKNNLAQFIRNLAIQNQSLLIAILRRRPGYLHEGNYVSWFDLFSNIYNKVIYGTALQPVTINFRGRAPETYELDRDEPLTSQLKSILGHSNITVWHDQAQCTDIDSLDSLGLKAQPVGCTIQPIVLEMESEERINILVKEETP